MLSNENSVREIDLPERNVSSVEEGRTSRQKYKPQKLGDSYAC